MIVFEKLDKVSSVICRPTPTLVVKHVLHLKRPAPSMDNFRPTIPGTEKKLDYAFPYNFSNTQGVAYQFGDFYIELETRRQVFKEDKTKKPNPKMSMMLKDLPLFLNVMDKAYGWLSNSDNGVYIRDVENKPLKVSDPLLQIGCQFFKGHAILKPCIIRDNANVRYEGISMISQLDGEFTNFTAPEFAAFRVSLQGFYNNYYIANTMLANETLTYCVYSNFMELLNKNANK